jgi:hypothetical protein
MTYTPDDHDEPRRDTIMRQRLRSARGDDYDEYDDDDYEYRSAPRYAAPPPPARGGSGCAQATLYLVLGGIATLLILLFFFRQPIDNMLGLLSGETQVPELVASPTPTIRASAAAISVRVRSLSRLETTSYTIEKVIEAGIEGNSFENLLFGDRLLLIARGNVEAGLDLQQVSEEDIQISPDGTTVTVTLPPVEIFDVTLNNQETRVYDREQGLFAPENPNLESQARQVAEDAILQTACDDGIMERTTEDSQQAMEQFLNLLEFEEVVIVSTPAGPCQVSP